MGKQGLTTREKGNFSQDKIYGRRIKLKKEITKQAKVRK